jgi:hypothetical protein
MMFVYLILAILSLPAYIFYFSGNAFHVANGGSLDFSGFLASFMLGNIGQGKLSNLIIIASTSCNSA